MVIGELDSSKMGLDDDDSLPNLIIYCLFVGLMCTIVLNLLDLYYLFLFILCIAKLNLKAFLIKINIIF